MFAEDNEDCPRPSPALYPGRNVIFPKDTGSQIHLIPILERGMGISHLSHDCFYLRDGRTKRIRSVTTGLSPKMNCLPTLLIALLGVKPSFKPQLMPQNIPATPLVLGALT
ncbi:uncharacterized protein CLUP02_16714 [Colletotrichum lupini]|uniref:Uncharacterized protein n=1 Tax=Colletotrichum lupini TaxID=145971 RepID=A0A9Q8T996_9PEZI|nr:uncharacterized protein CLUP02_16714 [Colletotrichum lupini]UQC91180.1 hypothetical protein CLUP02_16714 [Colletotrichum lupini]